MSGSSRSRMRWSARVTRRRIIQALTCVAVLIAPAAANPGAASATGPTAGVVDSFNRADGPVGPAWTKIAGFPSSLMIVGNQVTGVVGGSAMFWNAGVVGPDSESYATVTALPTVDGYFFGLLVRIQNPTTQSARGGYIGRVNVRTASATSDDWVIYKTTNGSGTIVSNGGAVLAGPKVALGDKIMTVAYGTVPTTVELWHFRAASGVWGRVLSYADSSNPYTAAGQIGLHLRDTRMAVDDFGGGTTQQTSPSPPANVTPPAISGSAQQGQTLTASQGSWTGTPPPTFANQWEECDSAGANCAPIGGATGNTYTLTSGEVGSTVRVVVTATNPSGSAPASSAVSAVVTGPVAPANVGPPAVSGTASRVRRSPRRRAVGPAPRRRRSRTGGRTATRPVPIARRSPARPVRRTRSPAAMSARGCASS